MENVDIHNLKKIKNYTNIHNKSFFKYMCINHI